MAEADSQDVRAAVAAGILTEAQAARLVALAASRSRSRDRLASEDEPFEFFRGFSEIFLTVGLTILFLGIGGLTLLLGNRSAVAGATMILAWSFAEYFTRRRRMSLPSIALASFFALSAARLIGSVAARLVSELPDGRVAVFGLTVALGGMAAMILYFWRFRLPFTTFLIGLFGAGTIFATAALLDPRIFQGTRRIAEALFDFRTSPTAALATLVFGICTFIAAMRFDLRDPHRVSRHSAAAFWLHLLAAPALVNTLAFTLFRVGGPAGYLATALALLVVAVLALVIDRRSFLTAGLVYVALLIGLAMRSAIPGWSQVGTLLVLGAIVTALGTWWVPLRARLMGALPDFVWKSRLPPYTHD